jgi:hypothetical protein
MGQRNFRSLTDFLKLSPDRYRLIAKLALAVAVIINVIQFGQIEQRAGQNWKAISQWDTPDLVNYSHASDKYGVFIALFQLAPQATIIVPTTATQDPTRRNTIRSRLFGIARIKTLQRQDYDPDNIISQLNFDDPNVIYGNFQDGARATADINRYFIFYQRNEVRSPFWLFKDEQDNIVLVEQDYLESES